MRPTTAHHRPAALAVALALVLIPAADAGAQYRDLCLSVPLECVPILDSIAPPLGADVCHSAETGITLKGASACPTGTWAYHVAYGEVSDPLSNAVVAYLPLENACNDPQRCLAGPPPAGAQEYPICCTSPSKTSGAGDETCVPAGQDVCDGSIWFCVDGVSNDDGTVTCFSAI
jgi:hypothetical protein